MLVGYRTYIVAAITATFGVLAAVDWTTALSNPSSLIAVGMAILMAVLRSITTTPPGQSVPVSPTPTPTPTPAPPVVASASK